MLVAVIIYGTKIWVTGHKKWLSFSIIITALLSDLAITYVPPGKCLVNEFMGSNLINRSHHHHLTVNQSVTTYYIILGT